MDTKDIVLLGLGGLVGIVGSIIASRLDRLISKVTQVSSKRFRQRSFKREEKRLKLVTTFVEHPQGTKFFVVMCMLYVGLLALSLALAVVPLIVLAIYSQIQAPSIEVMGLRNAMTFMTTFGFIMIVTSLILMFKLAFLTRDIVNYDDYKEKTDKLLQKLTPVSSPP